ncbi:ribonuclease H-like domain-containing protein [Tanacetum coccineum]
MDLEIAQTNTTAKLPILKQAEYEMWKLRIKQYFQVQDYDLWDVIENGNSFKPVAQTTTNIEGTSTTLVPCHVTADEKILKKNDVKARSMLLMALPNEHLLTFNHTWMLNFVLLLYKQDLVEDATKKTLKTLLKQIYENFSAPSTESLDSIFNRSLPFEWNTHVVVWRNKLDLDTMSFDDLYNNFEIVEQGVKGIASSSSSSQNMAFVSSPSISTASTQVSTANLSDTTVYAFLASQPKGSHLVHEDLEQIHEDDLEEMDLKWQLALLSMRTRSYRRTINVEETSSKTMLAIDGAGFDWSYMADDEVPTNMSLMAFSDFESLASEKSNCLYKKNEVIFCEQIAVLKRDISYKDSEISVLKSELEKLKQEKESNQLKIKNFDNAFKSLDKLIGSQIPDKSRKGVGFVSYNVVPPPHTGLFAPQSLICPTLVLRIFNSLSLKDMELRLVRVLVKIFLMRILLDPQQQEKPVRKPVKYADKACNYQSKGKGVGNNSYLSTSRNLIEDMNHLGEEPKGGRITADESQVLLKVPRKNNIYNVDMKNIIPKESLTYLVAKASLDESMLWHRGIENLIDLKVKVIRCDNGTEFKNKVMNQFCEMKGIKECKNAGKARVETVPGKDHILLLILTQDLSFSSSSKDSTDAGFKPSGEEEKKDAKDPENEDSEVPNTEELRVNQEQDANVNSTNNINTVSLTVNAANIENNVVNENIVYGHVDDPNMPNLEEIVYSDDNEDVNAEADMTNLDTYIIVSPTPTTKIQKDHLLE